MSQNYHNPPQPNHDSLTQAFAYKNILTFFTQISLTSNQDSFISSLPANKILSTPSQVTLKVLAYTKTSESLTRAFNITKAFTSIPFPKNSSIPWSKSDFVVSDKHILINSNENLLTIKSLLPSNTFWAKQAILPAFIQNEPGFSSCSNNIIALTISMQNVNDIRNYERKLDNYLAKLEAFDANVFAMICFEFKQRKRNFQPQGRSVEFTDVVMSFKNFRKFKVNASISNGVISIKIYIEFEERDRKKFTKEGFLRVKSYFVEIRDSLEAGIFCCRPELMQIYYSVNFYAFSPFENNRFTLNFIQKYLSIYSSHLENIHKLLLTSTPIESIISNGKKLKIHKLYNCSTVTKTLNPTESAAENLIIEKFNKSTDIFFASRFNNKSIKIENSRYTYVVPKGGEGFLDVCNDLAKETLNSIIELAEVLQEAGLYFIGNNFPINYFVWLNEKPIYTYLVPLYQLLEFNQTLSKHAYLLAFMGNLQKSTIELQRKKVCSLYPIQNINIVRSIYENPSFIEEDQHTANIRYTLYQDNNYDFMVKFHGITMISNRIAIICTENFIESAIWILSNVDNITLLDELNKLLNMISEILSKNTEICSFDDTCLGYLNRNLKWLIITNQQVKANFKAPEILQGRLYKTSLIYSFGKFLISILKNRYVCPTLNLDSDQSVYDEDQMWLKDYLQTFPENSIFFEETLNINKIKRANLERTRVLLNSFNFKS
ncbi:hypothetical protein SteCoe_3976 [Stentor coeruleus]|uniref:Uncharacterized protein n=1 Tax=Stentor coeruleus TaxID=5963 RepID=A0A1R2CVZ6_9CILI|nr:hypothetical protein SteCoe_3976 [Stentor coeruleus]